MKTRFFLFISAAVLFHSCSSQYAEESALVSASCASLPAAFSTYDEALETIQSADFPLIDHVNTSRSSWIRAASYYSCNQQTGFLIISTDGGSYVYDAVPLDIWYEFKVAPSFGSYYNARIKNRFILKLK
jgi:hypothetical protein